MPDLYQRVPANRSFRDVVNGTPNPLRNAWKETGNGGQYSAKSARAFGLSLFRPMALCAAVTLAGLCSSIYCAVGYVHYKRVAGTERAGTQQAERTNNDLQKKLDGIRDQLGVAKARINTLAGEAAPPVTVSAQDKIDPAAHWTRPLGQPDLQLSDPQPTAKPSQQASTLSDGHLQQSWTRITLDETENKIQQLSGEYDEVAGERDQLREHLKVLEETLSLLQLPQVPRHTAKVPPNSTSGNAAH